MSDEQVNALVLKDQSGEYLVVPWESIDRGRVPAEHRAEVERLVAEAERARSKGGDDTRGHITPIIIAVEVVAIAALTAGIIANTAPDVPTGPPMTNAQLMQQLSGRPFPPRP